MTLIDSLASPTKGSLIDALAVPQLVRRKPSGRYTVRYRERGSVSSMVSIGLRTTNKQEAINRMEQLSKAAKLFLLDNPEATPRDFNERLKDVAETFLMDDARSYWSHDGSIDTLGDLTGDLKSLALGSLNVDQHRALLKALEVVTAANERVSTGNSKPLVDMIDELSLTISAPLSDSTPILENDQGSYPSEIAQDNLKWSVLVEDCLAEKRLTLKEASIKDLTSCLKTISKYLLDSDYMSRVEWLKVRDTMVSEGLSVITVNKCITKAKMVIEYALMNQKVTGRNPIERIKMKEPEGNRKPFSEAQLVTLGSTLSTIKEAHRRSLVGLGLVTGARIGELVQLTPSDVVTIDGVVYIDINDNTYSQPDGTLIRKTLKNANSKRLVPLTDGLYGFSLDTFMADVKTAQDASQTLCKVTRDSASKWFNEVLAPATLGDTEGLVFHSLRHSMATQCKAYGVSEVDAGSILGHKAQSITYGLYGKTQALGRLVSALGVLKAESDMNNKS